MLREYWTDFPTFLLGAKARLTSGMALTDPPAPLQGKHLAVSPAPGEPPSKARPRSEELATPLLKGGGQWEEVGLP